MTKQRLIDIIIITVFTFFVNGFCPQQNNEKGDKMIEDRQVLYEKRFGYSDKGSFRCVRRTEKLMILLVIIIALLFLSGLYVWLWENVKFIYNIKNEISHLPFFGLTYIVIAAVTVLICFIIVKAIMSGDRYEYAADAECFRIMSPKAGKSRVDILYDDVKDISAEPLDIGTRIHRGLTVTITTRSLGTVSFDYLFGTGTRTFEASPFHIIYERSELLERKGGVIDGR